MRLSRIYVEQSLAVDSKITLTRDAGHYIRNVLRLKPGDIVNLFNGSDNFDYECRLEFDGKQTIANTISSRPVLSESLLDSQIIQGLGRSDHIDLSIQKCTELGIRQISIFNAQHSQIPLKLAQQEKRLNHWRAIAIKACEQCGRNRPPTIKFFSRMETALQNSTRGPNKFLLHFEGPSLVELLSKEVKQQQVSLLIGPEGGFSSEETRLAKQQGFISTRVGPRILRTETAAMASLAIIQSYWGDLRD